MANEGLTKSPEHWIEDIIWHYQAHLSPSRTKEFFAPMLLEWAKENFMVQASETTTNLPGVDNNLVIASSPKIIREDK